MNGPLSPTKPLAMPAAAAGHRRCRGGALTVAVHVLLLFLVLAQVVFLASHLRLRVDLTADRLWSLSGSTRKILDGLQDRLVFECYFSPKESLPTQLRDYRTILDNLLDELVQVGKGRVVVQRYDPNADKMIADKARRIGIKPAELQARTSSSVQVNVAWQGIRLIAGGQKQKVIEQISAPSSAQLEAAITMGIREVLTKERHKVGFMEWPLPPQPGQPQAGATGWSQVRSLADLAKRYEFVDVKDAEGVLIPEDIDTLFLFRPKDLTDRQKYVVDQFLMRGGKLVVFADVADYQIGPYRVFSRAPAFQLDAPGSQEHWLDQLACYGVQVKEKVIADWLGNNGAQYLEYLWVARPNMLPAQLPYPYMFHVLPVDWRDKAAELVATAPAAGNDASLIEQYKKHLHPGIDSDAFLFQSFKKVGRGPGLFWPCWTDLRRNGAEPDLPSGVQGQVLMWSSPRIVVEDPPQDLNPWRGQDPQSQQASLAKFQEQLRESQLRQSETLQQAPLMVELSGRFPSFFAGKQRPKRASEIKQEEAAKKAAEDSGNQQPDKPPADAADQQQKRGPHADDEPPQEPGKQQPQEPGKQPAGQQPEQPKPDLIGPLPPPNPDEAAANGPKVEEPAQLTEAKADSRIVVIGDADFIRDDLVRGDHRQRGGPTSFLGGLFFYQLVDWLAQDDDLIELQSRVPPNRALMLVEEKPTEAVAEFEKRRDQKKLNLQLLNILLPILLLGGTGVVVFVARRSQKRSFLSHYDQLSEGKS